MSMKFEVVEFSFDPVTKERSKKQIAQFAFELDALQFVSKVKNPMQYNVLRL